jgi:hypothetical protein
MTIAVCIKCGTIKLGALTPCTKCNFDPNTNEDKAKAMILTDHYLPQDQLKSIGENLQNGIEPKYPTDFLSEQIAFFEENPEIENAFSRNIKVGCFLIFVIVGIILIWTLK